MCMPVCLDVERPLDLRRWDWTWSFPRRHSHREQKRSGDRILGWTACSFTLEERSDRNDMVRQKSSQKQQKSLAGNAVLQSSRSRSVRPAATCVGMLRYSMAWHNTEGFKDLCSPRGAKKKVFLGTSSTVTLLEKNHARNVGQFWNLAGILLDYWRIIQT